MASLNADFQHQDIKSNIPMLKAATPYLLGALSVAIAGIAVAIAATSPIGVVAGAVFALMGAYGAIGILIHIKHAPTPESFKEKIMPAMLMGGAIAIGSIIYMITGKETLAKE